MRCIAGSAEPFKQFLDGHQPILDKVATDGHEHSALIFGAKEEVEAYLRCMETEK